MTDDLLAAGVQRALSTVRADAPGWAELYPDDCTSGGVYLPRPGGAGFPAGANREWTPGFVPGMQWLAWELGAGDGLRAAALGHVASFARRIDEGLDVETHDLGFLYTLSCTTAWLLAGDDEARRAGLRAADRLLDRFLEPAGIIQAWGALDDPSQRGRTIIDSLLNLPLLYWASEETGDPRYGEAARRHTAQLRDCIIREDDTTFHTFYWDLASGAPLRGETAQGYSDTSCWTRGQAWGIYGFALGYRHGGDPSFLDAACRCAEVFLARLPADRVPYWDLVFGDGSGQPRDASGGAIAVCGLDEAARLLAADDPKRGRYQAAARAIAESLAASYTPSPQAAADAEAAGGAPLLLHSVYDLNTGKGVDEGNLWGDYFYLEALARLTRPDWHPYWWGR